MFFCGRSFWSQSKRTGIFDIFILFTWWRIQRLSYGVRVFVSLFGCKYFYPLLIIVLYSLTLCVLFVYFFYSLRHARNICIMALKKLKFIRKSKRREKNVCASTRQLCASISFTWREQCLHWLCRNGLADDSIRISLCSFTDKSYVCHELYFVYSRQRRMNGRIWKVIPYQKNTANVWASKTKLNVL